jgi:hypothetical protein
MYKNLPKLNQENIDNLNGLRSQITFTDTDRRLGNSGLQKMSVYTYSKWKSWNRTQVATFKESLNQQIVDKALIGWFLKFSANTGFLDLMTTWVGKDCGTIAAFSLEDNQKIWLNGEEITLNKGEGIQFSLSVPHEIKPAITDQCWACLMMLE